MLHEQFPGDDLSDALDSLRELEQNVSESLIRRRASERVQITTPITVRPGNASERHLLSIEGMTGDLSNGGCLVLLPQPILPGDVYWLDFVRGDLKALGAAFARCIRCRFISEGKFEVGFRFFNNIDLTCALD